MRFGTSLAILSALAAAGVTYARYRRDMRHIIASVEYGGTLADTAAGPVEYAETGSGDPLLLIHGAGGGYDQGLLIARNFGDGFRIVAPSRFGYLRTPVRHDPSPAAQADAHAALLDHLGIGTCIVVGVSAGGPSAIEFALRYPQRTRALVLLVPRLYHPVEAVGVDNRLPNRLILRLVENSADFLFWAATKVARAAVVRFLGVPPEVDAAASGAERDRVTEMIRSVLPLSRRVAGIAADGGATVGPWPLDRVKAPTLLISAEDDLYRTLAGTRFTAQRIPGSELKVLKSGGHLMVGQQDRVRVWVRDFLMRARGEPRGAAISPPPDPEGERTDRAA